MKRSEKIIFTIELILILIFFLSIFVKNVFNDYLMFLLLAIILGIVYLTTGFEKDKNVYKKNIVFFVCFYSIAYVIITYGVGLLFGYVRSPFKHDIFSIIKNIFPIILVIVSSEFLRFNVSKKCEKNRVIYVLTIITFILIDCVLGAKVYNLSNLGELLEYFTSIVLPSAFRNWTLTSFAFRYGLAQNIAYRLILELYPYLMPITPDLGIYLESVFLMTFPTLLRRDIYYRFEKEKKPDLREKDYASKITTGSIILVTALIIALNSNLFRFWMAVIGSGSMEPTIMIGDAVIVDKSYQKHLDKLKEGDVLVFRIGKQIFTHRIIKIDEKDGNYSINTKGDRKGQIEDNWTVTNKDVIGVVKFKIKYIGYPTVWLNRILEGSYGKD